MAEDKVKSLYDAFVNEGYEMESESDFRKNLAEPSKRKAAYEALKRDGYEMEPFEEFETNIGYGRTVVDDIQEIGNKLMDTAQVNKRDATVSQPNVENVSGVESSAAKEQEPLRPTEQDKIRTSYEINQIMQDFNKRSRERVAQMRRVAERSTPEGRARIDAIRQEAMAMGLPAKVTGISPGMVHDNIWEVPNDGLTTQREAGTNGTIVSPVPYGVTADKDGKAQVKWLMPDGSLTTNLTEVDAAEYTARQNRIEHEFEEKMRKNGLDPSDKEDVQKQIELDAIQAEENRRRNVFLKRLGSLDKEIADAEAEEKRLRKEWEDAEDPNLIDAFVHGDTQENLAKHNAKKAAAEAWHTQERYVKQLKEARERWNRGKASGDLSMVESAWEGIKDGISEIVSNPFGFRSGADAMLLRTIQDKVNSGKDLTDQERRFMESYMFKNQTEQYAGNDGAAYQIAKFIPEMSQMALEFAGAPGAGITRKATEIGLKKIFTSPQLFGKALGSAVAEGASIASTTQLGKNMSEAEGRELGAPIYDYRGNYVGNVGDGIGVAMLKTGFRAVGSNAIFLPTTQLGQGVMRYLDKSVVGKGVADIFRNAGEILPVGNPIDGLVKMKTSELLSVGLGDETFGQWADPENNAILLGSLFASEFAMGLPGKIGQGYRYYNLGRARSNVKQQYNEAARVFSQRPGGEDLLKGIAEMIMSGNDEAANNIISMLGSRLRPEKEQKRLPGEGAVNFGEQDMRLSREEWVALTDLTRSVYRYMGVEQAYNMRYHPERLSRSTDEEVVQNGTPDDVMAWEEEKLQLSATDQAENSYADGMDASARYDEARAHGDEQAQAEAQAELDAIGERVRNAREAVEDAFGDKADYYMWHLDEDPWALLDESPDVSEHQQDAVLDYINAKAALDGVLDGVNETKERKREQVESEVMKRTHRDNGTIQPATLRDGDRPVYIVKGDVVTLPDGGVIDVNKSSRSIIVMDQETGECKFVAPNLIASVGERIDPKQELQAAFDQIEAEGEITFNAPNTETAERTGNPGESVTETEIPAPEAPRETSPLERIPRDSKGEPLYEQVDADVAWDGLLEEAKEEQIALNVIAQEISEREEALKKLEKKKPRAGLSTREKIAAEQDKKKAMDDIQRSIDHWKEIATTKQRREAEVRRQQEEEARRQDEERRTQQAAEEAAARRDAAERAEAEAKWKKQKAAMDKRVRDAAEEMRDCREAIEILNDMAPQTIDEVASLVLSNHRVLLSDDGVKRGVKRMVGLGRSESKKLIGQFAKAENGGISIERLAEDIMQEECAQYGVPYENDVALNALMDLILSARTRGDITGYIAERRLEQARRVYDEQAQMEDNYFLERYGMTKVEFFEEEEIRQAETEKALENFDETEYYNTFADKILAHSESSERGDALHNTNIYGLESNSGVKPEGEIASDDRGGEVLSGARSILAAGKSADGERSSVPSRDGQEGVNPQGNVGETSRTKPSERGGTDAELQQRGGSAAVEQTEPAGAGGAASARRSDNSGDAGGDRKRPDNLQQAENEVSCELSEETNEFGKPFVKSSDGTTDFGFIDEESNLEPLPIRLSLGENYKDENGANHGYGYLHIDAGHGEQIRNAGYKSVEEFVEDIAKNYTDIREGAKIGGNQTYLLEVSDEHNNTLFIQLSRDGKYWNVNSAGIFKKKYSRRKPKVYSKPAVGNGTATDAIEVNSGRNKGATAPAGNSSETSEHKVTNSASDKQENGAESSAQPADSKGAQSVQAAVEAASAQVNTSPTPAQAKAGNYKKGHVTIGEFDITIENPAGSTRKGVDAGGKAWSTTMANAYGEIKGTESTDGDPLDVFLHNDMDQWNGRKVFVVDQTNTDGTFDEHKVMLGFNDRDEAMGAYLANYDATWAQTHPGLRITETRVEDFNKWVESSHRKTKPFAEYKGVKTTESKSFGAEAQPEATERAQAKDVTAPDKPLTREDFKAKENKATRRRKAARKLNDAEKAVGGDEFFNQLEVFAKEYKEATNVGRLERKIAKWFAAQSDENLVSFDGKVLNRLFKSAGLDTDAQKSRTFRECLEKALSKERILAIWELRNKQRNNKETSDAAGSDRPKASEAPTEEKTVEKGKFEVTDEMKSQEDELRRLLGIDESEGDRGDMVREPEPSELPRGVMRKVYAAGVDYAFNYFDNGVTGFDDFAKAIVGRLGERVKPFVKSWYEGAKRVPGYGGEGYTPTEEVERYNLEQMHGEAYDPLRDAMQRTREYEAAKAAREAEQDLKEMRDEQAMLDNAELSESDRIVDEFSEKLNSYFESLEGLSEEEATLTERALEDEIKHYRDELTEQLRTDGLEGFEADRISRETITRAMSEVASARRMAEARRERFNAIEVRMQRKGEAYAPVEKPVEGAKTYTTETGDSVEFLSYGEERKLSPGEVSYVERKFRQSGDYDFTGSDRVESADDVAYIFRQLESFSTEHSFAVIVKDGKSHIIHIGMGNEVGTVVSSTAIRAASDALGGADKIYFVHNHPSGLMRPSPQDIAVIKRLQKMLPNVVENGIIIDTLSGQYSVFGGNGEVETKPRPQSGGERPLAVYRFNHTVFKAGYDFERRANTPEAAAVIISSLRLGQRDKRCMLVLNNGYVVVGSFVLESTTDSSKLADEAVQLATRFGGKRVIFFGNQPIEESEWKNVQSEVARLSGGDITAVDNITVTNGLNSETDLMEKKEAVEQKTQTEAEIPPAQEQKTIKDKPAGKAGHIEDFGEVLEGARKDVLKNIAQQMEDVTVESLVKLPLSQVFKRPDTKKAMESGALSAEEAMVVEAMSIAVLSNKKPATGRSAASKRSNSYAARREANTLASWAEGQKEAIQRIQDYLNADSEGRKAIVSELEYGATEAGAIVKADALGIENKELKPAAVMYNILQGCGFTPGQKVSPIGVDIYKRGSYWYQRTGKDKSVRLGTNAESCLAVLKAAFMLKNGIEGAQLPPELFSVRVTKREMTPSGEYRVSILKGSKIEDHTFGSLKEAEAFKQKAESKGKESVIHEIKKAGAALETELRVVDPIKHEYVVIEGKYTTPEEARAALDVDFESINAKACEAIMANNQIKRQKKQMFDIRHFPKTSTQPEEWGVVMADGKGYGEIISSHTSESAAKAAAGKLEEQYNSAIEQRRNHTYFAPVTERIGKDYRDGKDATAEMYNEAFGFRGVQFGNWTNQRDRQSAMNQAYDGLMDLAKVLGVPTRALSLGGELGIAFGARGGGSALAHYEPDTVVINLTKTKGEGSLAHEWWHALDNYFARRGGMRGGFATETDIRGMRDETADAFKALRDAVQKSHYQNRSSERGAYWGSMRELTARLFAQWVDQRLGADGEVSPFLSRGVDPAQVEALRELNWRLYEMSAATRKHYGGEVKLMSKEEFMKSPKALEGYVFATPEELEKFDPLMDNLFKGLEIRENEGRTEIYEPEGEYNGGIGLEYTGVESGDGKLHDSKYDKQGNPIDENGNLIIEEVKSIDDISNEDFINPTRTVGLPKLPDIVSDAIGANGKRAIIKKNIFGKNYKNHKDLSPAGSREILRTALYTPTLYGQNQKQTRPCNWILIHLADKNTCVLLEVDNTKENCEIVNWHYLREETLKQKERQAEREGGRILTLSGDKAVGNTSQGLSSASKVNTSPSNIQETDGESFGGVSEDGVKYRDGESAGERLRAIRALEPIEVEPNNMSKAELREVYNTLPSVNKDGREIEFYRSAFKKIYKDGGLFGQVVPVLDEVLEQSVLAYSEEDNLGGMVRPDGTIHKEHPNTLSFDNYVGKVDIDGIDHYVRITIQHDKWNRNGMHSCFVTEVEIYENAGFQATDTGNSRVKPYYSGIVDAKLQQFFERASSEALELDKADRVRDLSEKLNTPVRIVTEQSDIDNFPSARHRRSKGFFDTATGEVVIVIPNNRGVADVDNTFVHEVVGHKGLRALIGAERFDDFIGEVYNHASNPIRKTIDKMTDDMVNAEAYRLRVRKSIAHERAGEDVNTNYYIDMAEARVEAEQKREQFRKEATEEYMSDLSGRIGSEGFEKMSRDELTLWGKIKAKVQQFLDKFLQGLKIAKSIRLNDKDLSYILYKSWKNLRKKGVFADAEDAVRRIQSGYDADDVTRFRDPGMGLEETITRMKTEAMQANAGNLQAKRDAMRAIGGNLSRLRQAMARQREYDITTVKSVSDLARVLMDAGLLDDMSKYETKRILGAIDNVVGKQDVSKYVQKVMDIMVDNQLRMGANAFGKLLSIRGSRVDARGIEVQGELDPDGQRIVQVVRKSTTLPKDNIDNRIAEAVNRMSSNDQTISDEATIEYAGLQIARQYVEYITESKAEEKELRDSIKQAKEDKDAGQMTKDAYKQYVEATEEAIRQNKVERAERFYSLTDQLGGVLSESVERAKAWREAEKKRVNAIHHLANSDMQGRELRGDREDTRLMRMRNSWLVSWILEPMSTLDQMLKMFGSKNPNGEGYMQNHFMRGWIDAADREQEMKDAVHKQMDEKAAEIFGKHRTWHNGGTREVDYTYSDLYAYAKAQPGATIEYYDGAEMREYEIGQGKLLYLYAVDKMPMGRATNRRMGIDDATMQRITDALDPKLKAYADWVQDELLPRMGDSANEVHKKMFGADMDAIDNYFPFVRDKNALKREVENGQTSQTNDRISVQTGAIKKRVASVAKWDMRKCNFMDVLAKHVDEMCHWTSFAELNRDFGTLLSYNRLKQQIFRMNSVYGAGEQLWKRFQECCAIATDAYEPQRAKFDRAIVQGTKGVTMGKISIRPFTALKQTLSLPAFFGEVNMKYVAADLGTGGVKACQWAWRNMPNFRKRILSRTSGDYRLKENEYDSKIMKASSYGMLPNIGVDAWTIAVGSHGVYKTRKAKYRRWGIEESQAERRAVQDAELCYNKSQQSSEGPFMAPVQVDHTFYATSAMLFRNASTSYTREAHTSARNLKRLISGEVNEEYLAKQILRIIHPEAEDAWTDTEWANARKNAKREIRSAYVKNTVNLAMFGWILPWLWRIGGVAPLLLLSGDDDEKQKQWEDATRQSMVAPVEGLAYGDVIADGLNMLTGANEKSIYMLGRSNPIYSDIMQAAKKADKDMITAANDVFNIIGGMAFGVNPQTITDWTAAIIDYNSDVKTQKECALLVARLLSCPPSQLEKVYFDEIEATGEEAMRMGPAEIAERYAEYKTLREAPLTGWLYDDEARAKVMDKHRKRAKSVIKERAKGFYETDITRELLAEYEEVATQERELNSLRKTDKVAYREGMRALRENVNMRRHNRVKRYNHKIKQLTDQWLNAKSANEANEIARAMIEARSEMLEDIDALNNQ